MALYLKFFKSIKKFCGKMENTNKNYRISKQMIKVYLWHTFKTVINKGNFHNLRHFHRLK